MNTYRVKFQLHYPDADEDKREAYVLAKSFQDAFDKVKQRFKKECEEAYPYEITELSGVEIII